MDDVPVPSNSTQVEAYKRELYRKSLDRIRVYNPTDKDFIVLWGTEKYRYVFPNKNRDAGWGKGQRVVERYIAEKYRRDIKDYIINKMADDALKASIERLEKSGVDNYLWKANESFAQSGKYKTDNPELVEKIYKEVWLGIEEEFGMDVVEESDTGSKPSGSVLTVDEQVGSKLDDLKYVKKDTIEGINVISDGNISHEIPKPAIKESVFPINKNKKKDLVKEVSA